MIGPLLRADRVLVRGSRALCAPCGPAYPVTLRVYGGGLSFPASGPYPALSTRFDDAIGLQFPFDTTTGLMDENGWGLDAWPNGLSAICAARGGQLPNYFSLEAGAIDSNGVCWAAGCIRSTAGTPPSYHWCVPESPYAISLIKGWVPWAYFTMLPGWVLTPGSAIERTGGFPFSTYSLQRRGGGWCMAPL